MSHFITFIITILLSTANLYAANVVINGNMRIEDETILSHVPSEYKNRYRDKEMQDQISKNLFATNMFSNIKVYSKGNDLHIDLVENPTINKIYFEGNKKIEDDKITPYLTLKIKHILNHNSLNNDVNKIIMVYQASGRYGVDVTPKIIRLKDNRVNLVYEIKEPSKTHIAHIDFYGNKRFSDRQIRNNIQAKEYQWYRFLSDADIYHADKLLADADNIKLYYQNRGYAAVQVADPTIKLTDDKDQVFVSYIINEGEKYKFGKIDYKIALKNIDETLVKSLTITKINNQYSQKEIDKSIQNITEKLGDFGYAFTSVKAERSFNDEAKTVDITYVISSTPKYYIKNINITGNTKTVDKVIRREFHLYENDPFNQTKFNKTEYALNDLEYFEKVEIEPIQVSDDQIDINVNVKEKSTGYGNFAAGFEGDYGILGKLSYTENNLFGEGKYFAATLIRAQKDLNFNISYVDPYFFDNDYSASIDLEHTFNGRRKYLLYSEKTDSIGPKISYELYPDLEHSFGYIFKKQHISNVDSRASLFVREQMGRSSASIIQNTLSFDKRDSRINTEKGYYISITQSIAGLGGSKKYIQHELSTSYYRPVINDEIIFSIKGNFNHIKGLSGDHISIEDRFYMGGSNDFRGFKPYGLGPRDLKTNDALGGTHYSLINTQLTFPLGAPKEFNIRGALFLDVGKLTNINPKKSYSKKSFVDQDVWRASTGAGVLWDGPLGSIGVYYSHVLKKAKSDKKKALVISISTPI